MEVLVNTKNYDECTLFEVMKIMDMDIKQTNEYVSNLINEDNKLIIFKPESIYEYNGKSYINAGDITILCMISRDGCRIAHNPPCPSFSVSEDKMINYEVSYA